MEILLCLVETNPKESKPSQLILRTYYKENPDDGLLGIVDSAKIPQISSLGTSVSGLVAQGGC